MPPAMSDPLLNVVLYQPEIPFNTGSVGRTCVALGAKLWLVRPLGFRVDHHHLRRGGLDYWEHLDWEVVDDWPSLVDRLPADSHWRLTKKGARDYLTADFRRGDVLLFGPESRGLPDEILDAEDGRNLRIPTSPLVRSLNLSNSVAIVAYEARRQILGSDGLGTGEPGFR
ncbi:MAG: tRNA (cytidine(34)-2'-O)-methyltransferase [Planctomycetota bacterium]